MKRILFLVLMITGVVANAQTTLAWQKNIGGTNTEYANAGTFKIDSGDYIKQT